MPHMTFLRAAATLGAATLVLASPLAARQALELRSADGGVLTYSVPLDLGKTESWKQSGGRVQADGVLLLEGILENRGRTPARVTIFAVRAPGGTERVSDAERNLRPGGPESPILIEATLAPRERMDLSGVVLQNEGQVGRMVFGGLNVLSTREIPVEPTPIRIGVLAMSDAPSGARRPPTYVALTGFDVPLNPDTFPGGLVVPGDRWMKIDGIRAGSPAGSRLFLGAIMIPHNEPWMIPHNEPWK
ncbi:hypothetical protein BH23GEM11_BH23GEM11_06030 [soil metagenome]